MDVFLEEQRLSPVSAVMDRLAVASPLRAMSLEDLISEAASLQRHQIRYVAVRRQQVNCIGEHSIREILDEFGISVSCLGFAGGFTGVLGQTFARAVDDVRRAMGMAEQLGAASMIIVPGNRGLHTYRHAERIVLEGLSCSAELAARSGVRLYVPTDTVLADTRDCFRPSQCVLQWLRQIRTQEIRPMIVVRGAHSAWRLPRGWRESLATGGCLRICHRCEEYEHNALTLRGILAFLNRYPGTPES